jgi:hypothetical protein
LKELAPNVDFAYLQENTEPIINIY